MPKGPQGQKRPADVIGAAVLVGRIATGEVTEAPPSTKALAGQIGGRKGGKARAESLSPKKRKISAKKAAKARWG